MSSNQFPIHPIQAIINGWSAAYQKERAASQMTLGKLIERLAALPPETRVKGLGSEHSYRGYYSDLAFEPTDTEIPASALLAQCRAAMGREYEGYKGGDYLMGESTPLWSAPYGSCGDRLMDLEVRDGLATPVTAPDED